MRRLAAAGLALAVLAGCAFTRTPKVPMPVETLAAAPERGRVLFVLLPGMFDGPDGFRDAGFPEAARSAGVDADLVGADAHFGYYRERTILTRLREDVIQPARERGYEEIWLVGVSLGGVGSILYARDHPDDVDGILLLAPYLGKKKQVRRIADAGGVIAWVPGEGEDGFPWEMWLWFQEVARAPGEWPRIYLGYGDRDKLAPANALLAAILPEDHVFVTQGGHEWGPWLALWEAFLGSGAVTTVTPSGAGSPSRR